MAMLTKFADAVTDQLKAGANQAAGGSTSTEPAQDLGLKIAHIINIVSAAAGIAAVIVIIYAGFRFVISAGNPEGVKAAKNAIIYAAVGIVIIALAQAIVHFVIYSVAKA